MILRGRVRVEPQPTSGENLLRRAGPAAHGGDRQTATRTKRYPAVGWENLDLNPDPRIIFIRFLFVFSHWL